MASTSLSKLSMMGLQFFNLPIHR